MRKQLKNLRMWRRAAVFLFCVTFFCLLTLGGCSRDLGRGAGASSSAIGTVTSSALFAPSASSSASSSDGNKPGASSGSSGSSAAPASSGSGTNSPLHSSSALQSGAGVVVAGEGLNSLLVLVNRENALPADYIPADLTKLTVPFVSYALPERRQLRKEAAEAIVLLFEAAKKDKIELFCYSGYRSYASQSEIYNEKVKTIGVEATNKYFAAPGHSEHQTGLAMDVTNAAGVKEGLNTNFAQSKEGIWLAANAKRFGFIIRYPQGKEDITGYAYEPWHLRYVGLDAALAMGKTGQTLEEYLARGK